MAKKKSKGLSIIIAVVAVLLAAAAVFAGYKYVSDDINGNRRQKSGGMVTITSTSQYGVGQALISNEIINNDTVWDMWMNKNYPDFEYIPGDYDLHAQMSYEEIAQKLKTPDVTHQAVSVCIPEGYDIFKISTTLEENGVCSAEEFLNACSDKSEYDYSFIREIPDNANIAYPLEGFLFPATYDFAENMQAYEVVDTMLQAFADRVSENWRTYCSDNNMTLYELVTLSSVVEKETLGDGVAEKIASVFINRLEKGQQLQSDVTIDYGNKLREAGFGDETVSSYNTYKCAALPSGPICNPGVANIDAVVNHAETGYYYFFSYNNGADFYFTDDYTDFQNQWAKLGSTNTQ
ncbi:MAG: endolytic transglycosylase MltG [Clostridium sp.]|nr:endolytic transglycosylase MltG [Clostridium sp.]